MTDNDSLGPPGEGLAFRISDDGHALVAECTAIRAHQSIDVAWVRARLAEQKLDGPRVSDSAMAELLRRYNSGEEAFVLPLGEVLDGRVSVEVSNDRLTAWLTLIPPQGGKPVNRQQIAAALEEKGVVHGLDGEVIGRALESQDAKKLPVARGQPPVDGTDGKLEVLVSQAKERRPRVDEKGIAHYRELGGIVTVKPGDALMRRIPPTQGLAGKNVLGQDLPAKPGREMNFASALHGAAVSEEDANLLVATQPGQPVLVNNGVNVEPTVTIKDVDLTTGNLSFEGTVNIKGDVHEAMEVRATGDIHVDGMVEAAVLDAGGDIVIKGGVIGHNEGHDPEQPDQGLPRARLHCGGTLSARFIENAVATAGDTIQVDELALQSDLTAANQVLVGGRSGKGRIFGGTVQATRLVQANVLGSPANVRTVVWVGVNPYMNERLREVGKEQAAKTHEKEDVTKILAYLEEHPERAKPDVQERARNTLAALESALAALAEERAALEA